ncbi:PPC domain-containing protein [Aliikangiella sp. IMCC44359]|uniref:PPC domain-containing protein n=1 Tax=Aliikangiella sp. IMCC44359 TaxID=3459125 RepID=UPI00403B1A5E
MQYQLKLLVGLLGIIFVCLSLKAASNCQLAFHENRMLQNNHTITSSFLGLVTQAANIKVFTNKLAKRLTNSSILATSLSITQHKNRVKTDVSPPKTNCSYKVDSCTTNNKGKAENSNFLKNRVPKKYLSLKTGESTTYKMQVPEGASNVNFNIEGGTGDADLYVKFGSKPTANSYDCRPHKNGNNEYCNVYQSGGIYYIQVTAHSEFKDVVLTGNYISLSQLVLQPIKIFETNIKAMN